MTERVDGTVNSQRATSPEILEPDACFAKGHLFPLTTKSGLLAFAIILAAVVLFVFRGYHDEREVLQLRDFKQPYASARCLLTGCNPYSEKDTEAAFVKAGGVDSDVKVFEPYSALYPPFSFALLSPVAALSYPVAAQVWMALTAILFALAAFATADLCVALGSISSVFILSILVVTSTILLMLGQISGPVISLCVIGLWCLIRNRLVWLAIPCLVVAAILKPHDAALLILYLPFAGRKWFRTFAYVAVLSALVAVAGIYWCARAPASANWVHDLSANLKGNSAAGAVNDPHRGYAEAVNMANLQALLAPMIPAVKRFNDVAYGISLLLLAAWAIPAWRMRNGSSKHLLAVASMACITLLPIYHRQYDTRILMLLCPVCALLLAWRRRTWGVSALLLTGVGFILTAHQFLDRLTRTHHPQIANAGILRTVLFYRPLPLTELVLACFFICAFWAAYLADEASRHARRSEVQLKPITA